MQYAADKRSRHNHGRLILAITSCVLVSGVVFFGVSRIRNATQQNDTATTQNQSQPQKSNETAKTQTQPQKSQTKSVPASFNKNQYSIADPSSIWIVVNKRRPLNPISYTPADLVVPTVPLRFPGDESMRLRTASAQALEQLFAGAKSAGHNLMLASGYRSYEYQSRLYNHYVSVQGKAVADTQSARPGYSEHQTGWAADVEPTSKQCEITQCFANLPEGKWIAANAYKYGFIIRYPKDNMRITGYEYEPWHLRYVGIDLATRIHTQNTATLENFFSLPAAPDY